MSTAMAVDVIDEVDIQEATRLNGNGADVFRSFVERSGVCVARLDRNMRVVAANTDFVRRFGRSLSDVHGRELPELLHPHDRVKIASGLRKLADEPATRFAERVAAIRSGHGGFSGELTALGITGDDGRLDGVMVIGDRNPQDLAEPVGGGRKHLLSEIDARILEGVGAGISTVQMAANLYLSRGGVEYHVTTLLRRFTVRNRPALISKAYSMGIFRVGSWPPRVLPGFVR